MPTKETVTRLEVFAYVVRSLWDFFMIYGGAGQGKHVDGLVT